MIGRASQLMRSERFSVTRRQPSGSQPSADDLDLVVLVDVHERRQGLEAEGLDRGAVGVGEDEELLGRGAHEA